jgi:hypothetical protein
MAVDAEQWCGRHGSRIRGRANRCGPLVTGATRNVGPAACWPSLRGRVEVRTSTSGAVSALAAAGSSRSSKANAPPESNSIAWRVATGGL